LGFFSFHSALKNKTIHLHIKKKKTLFHLFKIFIQKSYFYFFLRVLKAMRLLKFFGVSRSPSFKQLKYNALGYLKIMFNAPKLLVQSTKDIIPSSSSSSLKKKKKKTFLVPGNPSEFERDMEFATKQGLHVRINQERFLPPAESGGLRIDAYRERRAHRLNRRRIERDAIGNVIWSVEKKQEEIIKEKEEEEMANKIVYTKFIEYGSIREQPFAWVNEKTGIKEIVMWLGTPEERRNLAEREPVFPEIFMGPEILRPGEEFGFLDQWTLYHDSMVGGKSSGKLEILSNSRIRKEEGGKSKVDHDAPSVFRVIESWTRQDQESSYEKDRGVRKLSNLNVRSNITNRIFKLLDDAHFLGVTILRFSGKRIPSENKATQSEIRKAEEDDEVSVLSKLGKASRAERMEINMGETACMSGKSEEAISLREFDSFELICREIECDDEDLELEPNTDYPDETYIIAKAKLKNPDHERKFFQTVCLC
jgi:hypothetical protein